MRAAAAEADAGQTAELGGPGVGSAIVPHVAPAEAALPPTADARWMQVDGGVGVPSAAIPTAADAGNAGLAAASTDGQLRRALEGLSDFQVQSMAELSGYQGPAVREAWESYVFMVSQGTAPVGSLQRGAVKVEKDDD